MKYFLALSFCLVYNIAIYSTKLSNIEYSELQEEIIVLKQENNKLQYEINALKSECKNLTESLNTIKQTKKWPNRGTQDTIEWYMGVIGTTGFIVWVCKFLYNASKSDIYTEDE
ncbi:MAG TPA: hypothetical protein VGW78_02250 [Candidatus Babeliales bacterium]|jgi:uncharacterized protein YlxW (UPF0749 family)|nr:hypothetical protein [Candidatus Babeliales bacterium]